MSLVIQEYSAGYRGRKVVDRLTVPPIEPGMVTALVGPNGAGKSTLLRSIAGLQLGSGSVKLNHLDLARLPMAERTKYVSFMPQALPQRVALTVLEAVLTALRVSPTADRTHEASQLYRRAMAVLDRIGIANIAMERLDRLSGGQRQLASLAQAIVREPKLLLLDEPTSSLDLKHQVLVMNLIGQFAAEGRIVIIVLHDLNLAVRWAGGIVVLNGGKLDVAGKPESTITNDLLARVYGVQARVEICSQGRIHVLVDGPLDSPAGKRHE